MKTKDTMLEDISKDAGGIVQRVMKQAHAYAPKNKGRGQGDDDETISEDEYFNRINTGTWIPQPTAEPEADVSTDPRLRIVYDQMVNDAVQRGLDREQAERLASMQIGAQSDIYGQQLGAQRDIAGMQRDVSLAGMASQERMLGSQLASTEALTREWYTLTSEMQKTGLDAQKAMHAAQLAEVAERRLMEERLGMRKIDLEEKMALMNILSESKKMGIQAWMAALQTQEAGLGRRARQSTDIANINAQYNLGLLDRAQGAAYGEALRGNESPVIRSQIPERFLTSPAAGIQLEPVANVQMPSTQISPEEIEAMLVARKKGGGQGQGLDATGRLMRGVDDEEEYKIPFAPGELPGPQLDPNARYGEYLAGLGRPATAPEKTEFWESQVGPRGPIAPAAGQTWKVPGHEEKLPGPAYEPGQVDQNVWRATIAQTLAAKPQLDDAALLQYFTGLGIPPDFASAYLQQARRFSGTAEGIFKKGLPYTQAYNEAMAAGIPQEFLVNNPATQIPRTPPPSTDPPINKGVYAGMPIGLLGIEHPARWAVNPMQPSTDENARYFARFGKDMPNYRKPGGGGGGVGQGYSFLDEPPDENTQIMQWMADLAPEERTKGEEWIGNLRNAGKNITWKDYWKLKTGSQEPGEEGFDWAIPGALKAIAGSRSLPPGPIPSGLKLPTAEQSANMAPSEWGVVRKGLKAGGVPWEDYENAIRWHTPPWQSKPQASSYQGF